MKNIDKIKVVIVEDEQISSDELKYIISKNTSIKVIGQPSDGLTALEVIKDVNPDIIFIDINIPGKNGIELAEEIKAILPETILIFSTAYDTYAIKAFELKVYDYILKPYDEIKISETLNSALDAIKSRNEIKISQILNTLSLNQQFKKIPCEICGKITLIEIDKICFCFSNNEKNYVRTYKDTYYTTKTLHELSEKTNFFRCHKSYIVNLEKVKQIYSWFNGTYKLIMDDYEKSEIPVSRTHVKDLKNILGI